MKIDELISRWDTNEGKPYKGDLIDWDAYDGDGLSPPNNIGCMCAQGQVLHLLGARNPAWLRCTDQRTADAETARLLNISRNHAVLLRLVNDSVDGAPAVVLTRPERILGSKAQQVMAFWRVLDGFDFSTLRAAKATRHVAEHVAVAAAVEVAGCFAARVARDTVSVAGYAAMYVAGYAAGHPVRAAAGMASNEIQGADVMLRDGNPFYFLPMFGFQSPDDVPPLPDDYGPFGTKSAAGD